MEKIFNDLETRSMPEPGKGEVQRRGKQRAPFTDVQERDNEIVITADLPGVSKEEIEVRSEGDSLIISAKRGEEKSEEGEDFIRRERSYGRFYRKIKLPSDVEQTKAEATFQNGVLEITLPKKKEEKEGKEIDIK